MIQISMYCFTSPDTPGICAIARGRSPGNSEGGGPGGELGIFEGPHSGNHLAPRFGSFALYDRWSYDA